MRPATFLLTLVALFACVQASSKLKSSASRKAEPIPSNACKVTLVDNDYSWFRDSVDILIPKDSCHHALALPFDLDNDVNAINLEGRICGQCSGKLFPDKNEKGKPSPLSHSNLQDTWTRDGLFIGHWYLWNIDGMDKKVSSLYICC